VLRKQAGKRLGKIFENLPQRQTFFFSLTHQYLRSQFPVPIR
jgi:hypothetical protein